MTREAYVSLARRIHDVPHAPQGRESIQATADDLEALCSAPRDVEGRTVSPDEQAGTLMQVIRDEWREWRGPAGLRETYFALFAPRPEHRRFAALIEPKCKLCKDSGWREVRRGDYGGVEKCTHSNTERPN